jgi:hypothetical protein
MANFYPPGLEYQSNTIAIDFDGVIHNAHMGWGDGTCYGEPLPGALDAVRQLAKKYNIIIFTAKAKPDRPLVNNKTGITLVKEWLQKYDIIDCVKDITSEKPRAELYIDDNGYRFQDWDNALKFVENEL